MHTRRDGEQTRHKILEAACTVFGEKGYQAATHAEICRLAGVNTAAINFHFGSKDNLYRATWDYLVDHVETICPFDGGIAATAPAAERLKGHIRAMLFMAMNERFMPIHRIFMIELLYPTGLLDERVRGKHKMLMEYSEGLVRELLGPGADGRDVVLCHMSFMAQWKSICFSAVGKAFPQPLGFSMDEIDELATHMTEFCLAGIRDRRRQRKLRVAPDNTRIRPASGDKKRIGHDANKEANRPGQ